MKTLESVCLRKTFPQTDRLSILGSQLHICIIPVWHDFKAQRLRQRRALAPSVRLRMRSQDSGGGRSVSRWISSAWSAAAVWSCILSQTHYCCPLTWAAEHPVFTTVSYDPIQHSLFLPRAVAEALTTCSSVWLHLQDYGDKSKSSPKYLEQISSQVCSPKISVLFMLFGTYPNKVQVL